MGYPELIIENLKIDYEWNQKQKEERMTFYTTHSIQEEVVRQSQGMGFLNFICSDCQNYEGGCKCKQGVFIAFTGGNMSNCHFYQKSSKCPHCGKNV